MKKTSSLILLLFCGMLVIPISGCYENSVTPNRTDTNPPNKTISKKPSLIWIVISRKVSQMVISPRVFRKVIAGDILILKLLSVSLFLLTISLIIQNVLPGESPGRPMTVPPMKIKFLLYLQP